LKSIESKNFEKVPLDAMQLDGTAVKQIEKAADQFSATDAAGGEPKRVNKVPRKALLKPEDAEHRLQDQNFALGDRVVYVQDSGKVPIASRGTVIGISRSARITLLDIVFDVTFLSGTTLGERCSPFRGMTVPTSSVLNLTSRQLIAETKASNVSLPSEVSQNGYRPARAPAPLVGSFSGAVSGQSPHRQPHHPNGTANGFRGRGRGGRGNDGGVNPQMNGGRGGHVPRGPTNMTMRGGPPAILQRPQRGGVTGPVSTHQVQPSFNPQPRQFQNVPPPQILNPRGRGGGRGRARGRGRGAQAIQSHAV